MIREQGKCAACEYFWFAAALIVILMWSALKVRNGAAI
jgi:hypothetical protein